MSANSNLGDSGNPPASLAKPNPGALQAELAVQKDRYLRLAADFDNAR
jgi:molecular chaperone GrpE (heat shock protein)